MQDTEYTKTLTYFFANSNENEVDGREIAKIIIEVFPSARKLKWLDVGSGPGGKLAVIAEYLAHWGGPAIDLVAVDPSKYWIDRLKTQLSHGIYGLQVKRVVLDRWEDFYSKPSKQKYDVVTFMHSIYGLTVESGKIPSLLRTLDYITQNGIMIIAVESPSSDLYKIKKELFGNVLDFNLVDYRMVENTFDSLHLKWQASPDLDQYFLLGKSKSAALSNAEALAFIVQTTPENYNKILNERQKHALRSSLSLKLKKGKMGYYISVPDRIYLIRGADAFGSKKSF